MPRGHQALLDVLAVGDPDAERFGEAVEELTKALAHHLDEEERTILNPARERSVWRFVRDWARHLQASVSVSWTPIADR